MGPFLLMSVGAKVASIRADGFWWDCGFYSIYCFAYHEIILIISEHFINEWNGDKNI